MIWAPNHMLFYMILSLAHKRGGKKNGTLISWFALNLDNYVGNVFLKFLPYVFLGFFFLNNEKFFNIFKVKFLFKKKV